MTAILGISAYYHNSAAAPVVDGEIVIAAQEDRFTRRKHDHECPIHAIKYCFREGNLDPGQLDYVGFNDRPLLKFDRLLGDVSGLRFPRPSIVRDGHAAQVQ